MVPLTLISQLLIGGNLVALWGCVCEHLPVVSRGQEDFKRVEFSKCGPVHDAKFGSAVMGHVKQQPALEPCFRVKIISSGSCYK